MFVPSTFLPDPHDPSKAPDWRWRRCGYLLRHGRQPLWSRDDNLTLEAWRFRQILARCRSDADFEQLVRNFPALAEAHAVYIGEPLKRWELEARLLGGDSNDAIAARCGISSAGVGSYHDTFYAVRPHLHADTYVVTALIGPRAQYGLTASDHEVLLKMFGYAGGACAVDAVLDYLKEPSVVPESLDGLDLPALKKLRGRLRMKVLILALTTPAAGARPETWRQLLERFSTARREAQGGNGEAAVLASVHILLDVLATLSKDKPVMEFTEIVA